MTTTDPLSLTEAQRLVGNADTILLRATRDADLETPIGAFLRLETVARRTCSNRSRAVSGSVATASSASARGVCSRCATAGRRSRPGP